jgi:hypothetical protein
LDFFLGTSPPLREDGSDFFLCEPFGELKDSFDGCLVNIFDKNPPCFDFDLSAIGYCYYEICVTIDLLGERSSGWTTLIVRIDKLVMLSALLEGTSPS